eukprot:2644257-Prymnesium_polylepis.1
MRSCGGRGVRCLIRHEDLSGGAERCLLGQGGQGIVCRAMWAHAPVAAKELRGGDVAELRNEADKLASLNHPNIVRLLGADFDGPLSILVMEFIDGGWLDPMRSLVQECWAPSAAQRPTMSDVHERLRAVPLSGPPAPLTPTRESLSSVDGNSNPSDMSLTNNASPNNNVPAPMPCTPVSLHPREGKAAAAAQEVAQALVEEVGAAALALVDEAAREEAAREEAARARLGEWAHAPVVVKELRGDDVAELRNGVTLRMSRE